VFHDDMLVHEAKYYGDFVISRLPLRSAVSTHSRAADNTGSGGSDGDRGGKRRALGRPEY
jgi:hypothetical protein